MAGNVKAPTSLLACVRVALVPTFVTVTVEPGMRGARRVFDVAGDGAEGLARKRRQRRTKTTTVTARFNMRCSIKANYEQPP
jgi:hypothetical protein